MNGYPAETERRDAMGFWISVLAAVLTVMFFGGVYGLSFPDTVYASVIVTLVMVLDREPEDWAPASRDAGVSLF